MSGGPGGGIRPAADGHVLGQTQTLPTTSATAPSPGSRPARPRQARLYQEALGWTHTWWLTKAAPRCGLMKPSPRKLLLTLQDPLDTHLLSTALAESPGHACGVQPQAPEAQRAGLRDPGPDGVLGRADSGSACWVHTAVGEVASGCSTQNSQLSSAQSRETWPPARLLGLCRHVKRRRRLRGTSTCGLGLHQLMGSAALPPAPTGRSHPMQVTPQPSLRPH